MTAEPNQPEGVEPRVKRLEDGHAEILRGQQHIEERFDELGGLVRELLGERNLIRWGIGIVALAIVSFGVFLTTGVFQGRARDDVQDARMEQQTKDIDAQDFWLQSLTKGVNDMRLDVRETKTDVKHIRESLAEDRD